MFHYVQLFICPVECRRYHKRFRESTTTSCEFSLKLRAKSRQNFLQKKCDEMMQTGGETSKQKLTICIGGADRLILFNFASSASLKEIIRIGRGASEKCCNRITACRIMNSSERREQKFLIFKITERNDERNVAHINFCFSIVFSSHSYAFVECPPDSWELTALKNEFIFLH